MADGGGSAVTRRSARTEQDGKQGKRAVVRQYERGRLERLRGDKLPKDVGPGARGIEHVARNPRCVLLRAVTMAGASPARVMTNVIMSPAREGQSPFAIAQGVRFEQSLLANGAAELFTLYRSAGRLTAQDVRVLNIAEQVPGSSPAALLRRKILTRRAVRMKLEGDPLAPNLIIKPRLDVTVLGVSYEVEPDVFVGSAQAAFYTLAEMKSYPDRGGKTDPADIRSACRQSAVGVYALRELLTGLSVADPVLYVPAVADLILRKPGSMCPTLHSQPIQGEYTSVAHILMTPPQDIPALEGLLHDISPTATLSDRAVIDALAINYMPNCRDHCPLFDYCKMRALHAGDPGVIDLQAREVLAPAGDLRRGYALIGNTVASYHSPEEQELAQHLREAHGGWKEALSHE
jgi:hypothetical protein